MTKKTMPDKTSQNLAKGSDQKSSVQPLVSALKKFFRQEAEGVGLEAAFLFGSRARGVARKDSDVDVAVLFTNLEGLSDDDVFQRLTALTLKLTKSLDIETNVMPIYPDFRKPMLYYNAIVIGVPLFVKRPEYHAWLRLEAIRQMEDFQIFGTGWQIQAARKNLYGGKRD
jgi:predicted nucleotidyltransferase